VDEGTHYLWMKGLIICGCRGLLVVDVGLISCGCRGSVVVDVGAH
jgi:hypothetical protein